MSQLGKDCKLYYCATALSASNTPATASWLEIDNVRDLAVNADKGEADVSSRKSSWRQTLGTLKNGSLDFDMVWEPADPAFAAIRDAFIGDGEVAMAAMDGDITGSTVEGLASNFSVTTFTRNEPLEEGVTVAVTVKPSSFTEWYEKA